MVQKKKNVFKEYKKFKKKTIKNLRKILELVNIKEEVKKNIIKDLEEELLLVREWIFYYSKGEIEDILSKINTPPKTERLNKEIGENIKCLDIF